MSDYYKHPQALVESKNIGAHTRIWAFVHILPEAQIGSDCNICDHVFIENDVLVGDSVTIKSGVQLWDGIRIEDNVFVGPNATFTNDLFPRSKQYPNKFLQTIVHKGASIGANATILAGLSIGSGALIGAGAVVTKNVPANAIVIGNPARITGYVGSRDTLASNVLEAQGKVLLGNYESSIPGVQCFQLPIIPDLRGSLSFAEIGQCLPFEPRRYFLVFDVPSREVRGEHAHRSLHQFLVCVKGSCSVMVDNGKVREEYLLNSPGLGIHVPPMVWSVQYKYSLDAVLLVLASDVYDPDDYIRDYEAYLTIINE